MAEQPSRAPYGFGAAWTFAFDTVYDLFVVKPTKAIGLVLYWAVELGIIALFTHVVGFATTLFAGGLVGIQRSRLRSGMAMSFLGVAAILVVLLWNA